MYLPGFDSLLKSLLSSLAKSQIMPLPRVVVVHLKSWSCKQHMCNIDLCTHFVILKGKQRERERACYKIGLL